MVTFACGLYSNFLQPLQIEQVPGKVSAGARVSIVGKAVAIEYPLDPQPGSENHGEYYQYENDDGHVAIVTCPARDLPAGCATRFGICV